MHWNYLRNYVASILLTASFLAGYGGGVFFGLWMFSLLSAGQSEGEHKDKVITDQQKAIDHAYTSFDIFDRAVAANQQCVPLPASLTQPVPVPLPPVD